MKNYFKFRYHTDNMIHYHTFIGNIESISKDGKRYTINLPTLYISLTVGKEAELYYNNTVYRTTHDFDQLKIKLNYYKTINAIDSLP